MTYTTDFEYTAASALKVSNVVAFLDKRNGSIVVEFDCRGKDWVAGAPYPQAKIKYGGVVKSTIDLTNLTNAVSRHRVIWEADTSLALINHGSQSIVLDVDDEEDDTTTFTQSVIVDLDPVGVNLGRAIGAARMERGGFVLRHFPNLAVKLGG